ncbi:MAG: hypothetical protein IJ685_10495 [Selenomonadaceae bacterium]|nr:hypothetical protein [Selenomonadaceae bacterium]
MKKFFVTLLLITAVAISSTVRAAEFEMVEYSAQVKLQWLAAAGIPQAQKFLKEINRPVFFTANNLNDFERLQRVNSLYQELNFAAAINFVREKNYSNVMDLACSLSPRAMILGDDGRKVIVGELATVCLIGDWMVDEFGAQSKNTVDYEVISIEDSNAMMTNADKFTGEICIIEQGVMIYLDDLQRGKMYDNIHAILKKHGGCMITSDFTQKKYFTDVAAALYGSDAPTLYAETKAMYEKVLDDKIADEVLQDERTAMDFLAQHGLKAEKIPLFSTTPGLYCAKDFTAEQLAKVNAVAMKKYLWVITPID